MKKLLVTGLLLTLCCTGCSGNKDVNKSESVVGGMSISLGSEDTLGSEVVDETVDESSEVVNTVDESSEVVDETVDESSEVVDETVDESSEAISEMESSELYDVYESIVESDSGDVYDFSWLLDGIDEELYPQSFITQSVDLSDIDMVKYVSGISEELYGVENISYMEPMISSIPFSMVYVKCISGEEAQDVRYEMMSNIDSAKWICVQAEKGIAMVDNDEVIFFMGYADIVDVVYEKIADNDVEVIDYMGGY